jgi:CheY-like chemotaxis protein
MKNILVVDDEEGVRMLLEHYLSEDYNVISKEDGSDALSWINQGNNPDLVLADLEMPKLNGFELLLKMREQSRTKNIPYLIVSGKNKQENFLKSYQLGANDYISKPFSASELKEKVEFYLEEK